MTPGSGKPRERLIQRQPTALSQISDRVDSNLEQAWRQTHSGERGEPGCRDNLGGCGIDREVLARATPAPQAL